MKSEYAIINFYLAIVVLFVMLFQSVHSYEHILKQLTEEKCQETHDYSVTHFQHKHSTFDHCFSCEFTLSTFTLFDLKNFEFIKFNTFFKNPFFYLNTNNSFFKGISYSLRGPPLV